MEESASVPELSPSVSELSLFGSVASGSGGSDEARERGGASFSTQANALLRKNFTFQKRNLKTNTCIVIYPILVCILLIMLQAVINNELHKPQYNCGCKCISVNDSSTCQMVCGLQFSTPGQARSCAIPSPTKWPALMQVPLPRYRAARDAYLPFADLPDSSCRLSGSCPTTVLFTGQNQTLAQTLAGNLFPLMDSSPNFSDYLTLLSQVVPGTDRYDGHTLYNLYTLYTEPSVISDRPLYYIQPFCLSNSSTKCTINYQDLSTTKDLMCVQGLTLWRNSSSMINDELFRGYLQSNPERKLNEFLTAYDFSNTSEKSFNVDIWYNSTYSKNTGYMLIALQRIPRSMNVASNSFLKFLKGDGVSMEFEFVKEMPKVATRIRLEFSSLLGPLFFTWTIQLLLPVILTHLVYEKQQKLKTMMKIHGLNEGPYWLISYLYFLLLSVTYMTCFAIFGSLIGVNFFRLNDYSVQVVFYFICINLLIVSAFLVASFFSTVKTATVIGYIYVFGSGLLGDFLFRFFMEDPSFPKVWIIMMELIPSFSLYRGLYEFGQYSFSGTAMGTRGMRWVDLNNSENGMRNVMIIMVSEWMVLLPLAFYLNQVSFFKGGSCREPLFLLNFFKKKKKMMTSSPPLQLTLSFSRQVSAKVFIDVDNKPDISQERELVHKLVLEGNKSSYAVISDNLRKVYLGRDGNPDKPAVKALSLAVAQGECFGMLGPNGAGKTSFIHMMIGLIKPTSGTAYVQGMDIRTNMKGIYTNVGVCPQHDLLWETLTGREHLLFYGRLKNLKGDILTQAVDESLKSVNLFYGGVGDKQVRTYSGGMKRRLSVAISLIGDPKVVYMDEPSTGLDPVSRNNLWNVVKNAKKDRAIILTTHSMEEAEVLCDRLGIFMDGSFQCLGNPKELKARYGGTYVLTMNTAAEHEQEVETLVLHHFPNARKIYQISGTQKFEIPKQEVRISDVFQAVEKVKSYFTIYGWGLTDITLEDVFIKVAKDAQALDALS